MLASAITSSASGIRAASTYLDVTSNNIANSDTPGYKTGQITFQDQLYRAADPVGAPTTGVTPPSGTQIGSGVVVDAITGKFTQGAALESTGRFDLAIQGEGFFQVILPDGSTGYTRAGNFVTDNTGQLVTPQGYRLVSDLIVPANTSSITVAPDGTVTAALDNGTAQVIGQVTLTRFVNPGGLSRSGDNVYTATPAAGDAINGAPNTNGIGSVESGRLEQSNVELANELVNLIVAQQAFRFNTQALQLESQVLQVTTDLIR
ncbi:Flagellar basal-body rod protein FlgG [Gemmata obscuriglobus]|uniref:Flagellar basal-body rod protein FlgG n=1 Tax=Gemmata obscuriglobus TaxID=114 RepID=A0A2Z3H3E0_9BACT|nr:flagellar basal-body rod protein FlgG [Gemmata obscuriglobus]AWM40533.1 flagellar basal-body rod protein FlgG [Gemmata obscuriglobus]QEG26219.1 Flagellar basal-body rod protein FlgG [Gemmata obscuriglobus]VTS00946.1 flagellar basal-body rod protein : Flagellar basal-body rod protein FlgG OS=Thermodesulfobium narugense DSM 14796 GN=Thena_1699 PE=4 SV=1: Flg_bb_rod: Flg_bbr_C [Gemmata obscuriglobus UQM 2246]